MTVKLLTEHHLEFLSLKEGCIGSSESTLVRIVGNHMSRLNYVLLMSLKFLTFLSHFSATNFAVN